MIAIIFNRRDFEYDVHSLVKAFFPTEEVSVKQEDEANARLKVSVFYNTEAGSVTTELIGNDGSCIASQCTKADLSDRSSTKNALKVVLYKILSEYCGEELPWGNMTGIRPVKNAMQILEEGVTPEEASEEMKRKYCVSEEKARLAVEIAGRENSLMQQVDYKNGYSLYVGIPFCPSICLYCSFSSSPVGVWKDKVDDYVTALCREIEEGADTFAGKHLDTAYMGGGTPTTLNPQQMDRVLTQIEKSFDFSHLKEFTVEAGRPDSITREKLQVLRDHNIGRISINPQTMNQKTLDLIGRHHTIEQIEESYYMAREMGFDNINMDLIVGLPGEDMAEVEETMRRIGQMGPDSVTVHSLALKRAARLNLMKDQYQEMSFHNSARIMDMTARYNRERGLNPYYLYRQKNIAGNFENTGYALEGKECLYNILIMEEVQSILAFGAGASTKIVSPDGMISRVENVKDIRSYLDRIDEMIDRKKQIRE